MSRPAPVGLPQRKESPMAPPRDVTRVANNVEGQPAMQMGARVGYAVSGGLHLLIGWIALQVAWSASPKSADQSGALQSLAGSSLGRLTLWVAVLWFLALGLWQLASALAVRTGGESSKWAVKAKGIAKAVVYLALAWTSFSFTKGQPTSSKAQSAKRRLHCNLAAAHRWPVARGRDRRCRHGGRHLPRDQGLDQEVPFGPERESRHHCDPRGGGRIHRQRHRPG